MASSKLSDLPSATPASADLLYIVDVSDTTDSPDGSSKKTTVGDVLLLSPVTSVAGRTGAVTLTSADITDSTATGRAVLTAADAAAARSAIGAGVGNALTSGTLAQFAATTSAELAGVLTDETGSGSAVFSVSPTLTGTLTCGSIQAGTDGGSTLGLPTSGRHRASFFGIEVATGNSPVTAEFRLNSSSNATRIAPGLVWLGSSVTVGWSPSDPTAVVPDVAFARLDSNTIEINNGTRTASGGALRGLSVSSLTASGAVTSTRPLTANGDSSYLISGSVTLNPSIQAQGYRATPTINSGTSAGGTYLSFEANPTYSGTVNSPTQVVGFQSNLNCVTSTGTISIMEGFRSQGAVIGAAAVVSNWRGVRVLTPFTSSGGAVSIVTGLLIDDLTVGSSQNRAIQTGLGEVIFGDTVRLSRLLSLGTYTVATLPSASANAGAFAQVTDSNSTTNGNTVAGGGSNRVPVFSNGTNWIIK